MFLYWEWVTLLMDVTCTVNYWSILSACDFSHKGRVKNELELIFSEVDSQFLKRRRAEGLRIWASRTCTMHCPMLAYVTCHESTT